jgi:hypothetical protein
MYCNMNLDIANGVVVTLTNTSCNYTEVFMKFQQYAEIVMMMMITKNNLTPSAQRSFLSHFL